MALWTKKNETPARSWGCCGCGASECDLQTRPAPGAPRGEGYCWACVAELHIPRGDYRTLPRERHRPPIPTPRKEERSDHDEHHRDRAA